MPREFLGGGRKEENEDFEVEDGVSLVGFLSFSCSSSSSSSSSRELVLKREGLRGGLNWTTLLGFVGGFEGIDWWDLGRGREEKVEEEEEEEEAEMGFEEEDEMGFGGGREEKIEVLGCGFVESRSKEGFGSERELGFEEDDEEMGFGGGREEKNEVLGGGFVESKLKEGFGSEREMGFEGRGAVFSCSSSSSSEA